MVLKNTIDGFQKLSLYSLILYIGITISISWALSLPVLFILLMHLENDAQFLNITPLLLSSARLAVASSLAPVIVLFP